MCSTSTKDINYDPETYLSLSTSLLALVSPLGYPVLRITKMLACIFINNFYLTEAVLYCYSSKMKQSSIILVSIFLILGLYIFGSLLISLCFGSHQDCEYNIGCYVAVHSVNHTDELLSRIANLQHVSNMSQMEIAQRNFPLV